MNFPIDDRTQCLKEDNVKNLVEQIEKNIQLELKWLIYCKLWIKLIFDIK